jgi:hypothetical protein
MGGFIAAAIIAMAAVYQLIPRRDDSMDWEKKPEGEADPAADDEYPQAGGAQDSPAS